jgi:hypothetical protein
MNQNTQQESDVIDDEQLESPLEECYEILCDITMATKKEIARFKQIEKIQDWGKRNAANKTLSALIFKRELEIEPYMYLKLIKVLSDGEIETQCLLAQSFEHNKYHGGSWSQGKRRACQRKLLDAIL